MRPTPEALHERLAHYSDSALLKDGRSIRVRALGPADKALLAQLFARLSPRSMYLRFFQTKRELSEAELLNLADPDMPHEMALAVSSRRGAEEELLGVGWYLRARPDAVRAEVAFAVADEYQGQGIGTLLLEHLADIARSFGVAQFEADVLGDNAAMLSVFKGSGYKLDQSAGAGVVHVSFSIEEGPRAREARDERWVLAARESLRPLLAPKSVAVVGASRNASSIGYALLYNLRERFSGAIYPVNPATKEILGLACHPSLRQVQGPIDLVVIAVRAPLVEAVIEDCAALGVRSAVIISAGFAETSAEGKAMQLRIRDRARAAGMRLVGPNCIGLLNTEPRIQLNATFGPVWPQAGNVGMLSQSGAMGLALLDYSRPMGIGISSYVSVGNKADVSGNDLLAYWMDDEHTDVIALYLESFGNPRKFARIAPMVAKKKPIVAVKSGRSSAGLRAALSHSAALASTEVAVEALFSQAGVIRTDTFPEMLDVVGFLARQPPPLGPRIGVVTNAGGPAIMLADACEGLGLELPKLAPASVEQLRSFLPAEASFQNPLDMIASAGPEAYERALRIVGADPNIDALVVIHIPPFRGSAEPIAAAIGRGAGEVPAHKPVAAVYIATSGAPEVLHRGPRGQLPCYPFPENAARALAAAARYARWKAQPEGVPLGLGRIEVEAIKATITRALERQPDAEAVWLAPEDVLFVLGAAGIPCVRQRVTAPERAKEAAAEVGFPLVAKAVSPDVLHKSDAGLVLLDIKSHAELERAVLDIVARCKSLGARLEGILLQSQAVEGVETIVGIAPDPTFGPLVVLGLGGTDAEVLHDTAFHLAPVTRAHAEAMLDKLRSRKLFDLHRGRPARDTAALCDVVERVSALAVDIPAIVEMDLNPVMVGAVGEGVTVLDARIRVARS